MIRIAVASGKGGTGKTFISTNLLYTFRNENFNAVMTDCDVEAPNAAAFFAAQPSVSLTVTRPVPVINTDLCNFCGKCHEYCCYNAIFLLSHLKMIRIIEDLCHGCGACCYACNQGAISERPLRIGEVNIFSLDGEQAITEGRMDTGILSPVPVIKAAINNNHTDADIVLYDSPPGTSCPFIQTVAGADFVILVTEPSPFGFSDLKQSYEILKEMKKPCGVIINRSGSRYNKIKEWLTENNIPLLFEIPFEKEIAGICSEGKLAAEENMKYRKLFSELVKRISCITENQTVKPFFSQT